MLQLLCEEYKSWDNHILLWIESFNHANTVSNNYLQTEQNQDFCVWLCPYLMCGFVSTWILNPNVFAEPLFTKYIISTYYLYINHILHQYYNAYELQK